VKCMIQGKELDLFPIKVVLRTLGIKSEAMAQKEKRKHIPPARFRSSNGYRMYSPEEVAFYEYLFKELWPHKAGVKLPTWIKALAWEGFPFIQDIILEKGRIDSEEELKPLRKNHPNFSSYRLMLYIHHWRSILTNEEEQERDILDWIDDY
jgi:DNA-binding transcriptional MerR regulator